MFLIRNGKAKKPEKNIVVTSFWRVLLVFSV